MKILVTGATGHIGTHLVPRLIDEGHEVTTLSLGSHTPHLEGLPVHHVDGDIRDFDLLNSLAKSKDVVYHLAAAISIKENQDAFLFDVNVNGSKNVARACLNNHVKRLVHVSSIHAYDQRPYDKTLDESRGYALSKRSPAYDRSKAAGELAVKEVAKEGLEVIFMNPSGVIGPYDYGSSLMGQSLLKMYQGRLPILVSGGFNWVDVRDVVDVLLKAKERGKANENYIIGGYWYNIPELADMISEIIGKKSFQICLPIRLAEALSHVASKWNTFFGVESHFTPSTIDALKANPNVDYTKTIKTFDYTPRPIEETLKDLHQWWIDKKVLSNA